MQCIHVKAGMEDRYSRYLAGDWKKEQDAMQKAGYVVGYKAIRTEAHNPTDCNVILMTEYKDLATMEANADKGEQLGQELFEGRRKSRPATWTGLPIGTSLAAASHARLS